MSGVAPSRTIQPSDVALAAPGDEIAFGRLVAAHQADMARVAYVILGDRSLAQDATQSAWIAAWKRLHAVREPDRVRSWLLAIAANEARQLLRSRGRATIVEIDAEVNAPPRSDPSVTIQRLDLSRALARLSAADRALLALRYVGGIDAAELGAATGRSASGTRARLSRLTARLREDLER